MLFPSALSVCEVRVRNLSQVELVPENALGKDIRSGGRANNDLTRLLALEGHRIPRWEMLGFLFAYTTMAHIHKGAGGSTNLWPSTALCVLGLWGLQ